MGGIMPKGDSLHWGAVIWRGFRPTNKIVGFFEIFLSTNGYCLMYHFHIKTPRRLDLLRL